ncbi:MAG: YopX family protein, partial [Cyclobacteriaceae bacterium]
QDPPIWKNHYVLEQYTGLKDKNGVEIYVGDIVCDEENIEYEVYFDEENLCYMFKKGNIIFNKNFFKSLQVIGNIHEVIL